MHRLLFVCIENSSRSQMAEAFAHMHGGVDVEAASAGSKPSGKINSRAIAVMQERGYDLTRHVSKRLDKIGAEPWDYIITMGCGDACPWLPAKHHENWDLPDPNKLSLEEFKELRDNIEKRVWGLLARLNKD
jgi:protein-tyrosine-phosphatase